MSAGDEAYKYAFRDIVFDLVQRARENKEPDVGYRTAMLNVLGRIKNQANVFELDLEYLGLADFDPRIGSFRRAEIQTSARGLAARGGGLWCTFRRRRPA